MILFLTETLIGSASSLNSSTLAILNLSGGIVVSGSTALLTRIGILITNEYISNLKIRYTKLRDWINAFTSLYKEALETSMVDKKNLMRKKLRNLKRFLNNTLIRDEIMNNTLFKVEDIFGDILSKDSTSPEPMKKPN